MFFTLAFFFNDTATTEIYTLSLHDALPISKLEEAGIDCVDGPAHAVAIADKCIVVDTAEGHHSFDRDRKSTRLNSSHSSISYAVFCLKKKKEKARSSQ